MFSPPTKKRKSEQVKLDAGRVYDSKRYFIMMAIKSKYSTVNIIQCVVLLVWSSCYMMDIQLLYDGGQLLYDGYIVVI